MTFIVYREAEKKIILTILFSDEQVALIIQEKIIQAFQNFAYSELEQIGRNPALADIPITVS